ncbi:MAG: hypothetical protein AB9842_03015 [Bacteroidales bacterium]
MMHFFRFLVILFLCTPGILTAQRVQHFKDSCCLSTSKPMLLRQGDKVVIGCDTAYLVNAYRLRLYEKAKNYLMTLAGNTDKMIVNQAETAVNQMDAYFSEIQSRYFILSEEVKKSQHENKIQLQAVNQELDKARNDLSNSKNDLRDLEDQLKKSRRKEKTKRFVYGGIGIGAGLLAGALLFR